MPDRNTDKGLYTTIIVIRTITIVIYIGFLFWVLRSIVQFLILRQRYRDVSISLYYVSFLGLFIARVTQTSYQFSAINDP